MGKAIEIIGGQVTAPGATIVTITPFAGNSLQVRNTNNNLMIRLLAAWNYSQGAGVLRIKSPRLHDNVQNIRLLAAVGAGTPTLFTDTPQELISQDTLDIGISGSATAGDLEIAHAVIQYDDLPGISARFIDPMELARRQVDIMTVENTLALGTAGGWSGQEAINAEYDLMKANTDYALLGAIVSANCGAIRWQGADTGNLGVGLPGIANVLNPVASWFIDISYKFGMALIPVFNSANKAGILIDGAQNEVGTDTTVYSIFAELSPE